MKTILLTSAALTMVALAACSDSTTSSESDAGADSGTSKDSGGETSPNGCTTYIDGTTDENARKLNWGLDVATPASCRKIKVGQTFTWVPESTFDNHPLISYPDQPGSPIKNGTGSSPLVVTFDKAGLYGYRCDFHSTMTGDILVVP